MKVKDLLVRSTAGSLLGQGTSHLVFTLQPYFLTLMRAGTVGMVQAGLNVLQLMDVMRSMLLHCAAPPALSVAMVKWMTPQRSVTMAIAVMMMTASLPALSEHRAPAEIVNN